MAKRAFCQRDISQHTQAVCNFVVLQEEDMIIICEFHFAKTAYD